MSIPSENSTNTNSESLPFFELFEHLNSKGFAVEIGDYTEAVWAIGRIDLKNPEELKSFKYKLASLICRSGDEQEKFYKYFDDFVESRSQVIIAPFRKTVEDLWRSAKEIRAQRIKKRLQLLSLILVLTGITFCIRYFVNKKRDLALLIPHLIVNEPADFFLLDKETSDTLKKDEDNDSIVWDFGDGNSLKGELLTKYTYSTTGKKKIKINYITENFQADSTVTICDKIPDILVSPSEGKINENFQLINTKPDGKKTLIWTIARENLNDTSIISQSDTLNYKFSTEGNYQVICFYENQICIHKDNAFTVVVTDPNKQSLQINFEEVSPEFESKLKFVYTIILYLTSLLCIILIIVWYYLKKRKKRKEKVFYEKNIPDLKGEGPPFDIAFPSNDKLLLTEEFHHTWASRLLGQVSSSERQLHLKRTVYRTISNIGLFSPVFWNRSLKREYVFIVNRKNVNGAQIELIKNLIEHARGKQVNASFYYYQDTFKKLVKENGASELHIKNLYDLHYGSVLVFWGDGYDLLDTYEASVKEGVKDQLINWPHRVLVTPVPAMDWMINEEALAKHFHLLPMDTSGLLDMLTLVNNEVYDQIIGRSSPYITYSVTETLFEDIDELKSYIGDDKLFQCVCALAIYPKISWELMLHVFNSVYSKSLSYSNLLKVSRIPWIKKGTFPARLRLELLKKLEIGNELIARKTIITLLEGIKRDEDNYASNEKKLQLIINKFILYSHDPVSYAFYKTQEQEFMLLYKAGLIKDIPLKLYLQKHDPDYLSETDSKSSWNIPLNLQQNQTTLDNYISEKWNAPVSSVYKGWLNFCKLLLGGLMCLVILILAGSALDWSAFTTKEKKQLTPFKFTLYRDTCMKDPTLKIYGDNKLLYERITSGTVDSFNLGSAVNTYFDKEIMISLENGNMKLSWNGSFTGNVVARVKSCLVFDQPNDQEKDTVPPTPGMKRKVSIETSLGVTQEQIQMIVNCLKENNFKPTQAAYPVPKNEIICYDRSLDDSLDLIRKCLESKLSRTFEVVKSNNLNVNNGEIRIPLKVRLFEDIVLCQDKASDTYWVIHYDLDKLTLRPENVEYLNQVRDKMILDDNLIAEISAHTESDGSDAYNQQISQRMAQSIVDYLISKGIGKQRLIATGYGEMRPVASNTSVTGKACNRRVEINLKPSSKTTKINITVSDSSLLKDAENFSRFLPNKFIVEKIHMPDKPSTMFTVSNSYIHYSDVTILKEANELKKLYGEYFKAEFNIPIEFEYVKDPVLILYIRKKGKIEEPPQFKVINTFTTYLGGGNGKPQYENIELFKEYGIILSRSKSLLSNEASYLEISEKGDREKQNFTLINGEEKSFIFKDLKVTIKSLGLKNQTGNPFDKETLLEIRIGKKL